MLIPLRSLEGAWSWLHCGAKGRSGLHLAWPPPYLAFSAFLFSPPIRTPGTIQVKGCGDRVQRVSRRLGGDAAALRYLQKFLEGLEGLPRQLRMRQDPSVRVLTSRSACKA